MASAGGAVAAGAVARAEQERQRKRAAYIILKNIKKKGESKMALPIMIKDLVGKNVKITMLMTACKGKVAEIQDDWIRIVRNNGKEFFVKEDMITGIKVL